MADARAVSGTRIIGAVSRRGRALAILAGLTLCAAVLHAAEAGLHDNQGMQPVTSTSETDPYLWLEDVTGEEALAWVRARNARAQQQLERDPSFAELRDDLLAVLDSDERIPGVVKRGDYYYNFWRDRAHERGLWRRTTLDEYRKAQPEWEVLLDLDRLAEEENENWVWSGAALLRPDYARAIINLSRGGADADVSREFDVEQRRFLADGFQRAEAKGAMSWLDRDHVFIATDFGDRSMTESGYPRIAKIWQRGTPIDSARTVYEGRPDDMAIGAARDHSPGFERSFVTRALAFYSNERYEMLDDGRLVKIDVPNSAGKFVHRQHLAVELREPWRVGDREYAAGTLLITDYERFKSGERSFHVLFEPTDNSALDSFGFTRDFVFINVLEDVRNRIHVLSQHSGNWRRRPLMGAPPFGTLSIAAVDAAESNAYFLTSADYLTPTTLWYGEIGQPPERLKTLPELFDASGLTVSQHFAASRDGTKIPYFIVAPKDLKLDGENPTLLYGYGGFEVSLTPGYDATVGRGWISHGGVYVVANIRGGGEYGPRWHQAALKANRLLAYEDFAAVARDLVERKVTSRRRLGIEGGSNGGLLVGNMLTLYPDLFHAAVCNVPLLDMYRYNKLLAGASWMAEYGNPDDPEEWRFIRRFSPYQNLRREERYPAVLFTTSTRDDRVHPGHARKMMARMEEFGHDVLYYENIEGGHGGAANNRQAAYMQALAYTFLRQRLFPGETSAGGEAP
jgi:prolyl oligopeptidase